HLRSDSEASTQAIGGTRLRAIGGTFLRRLGDVVSQMGSSDFLAGPIEDIDTNSGTVTILGHEIAVSSTLNLGQIRIGYNAAVITCTPGDGSASALVTSDDYYQDGFSEVAVSGSVEAADPAIGRIIVNGVAVDYTPLLGDNPNLADLLTVGRHVLVHGFAY
ncbi:MAG: hypothetical protein D6698_16480, partial [Gammaproteobacteria bacterium]